MEKPVKFPAGSDAASHCARNQTLPDPRSNSEAVAGGTRKCTMGKTPNGAEGSPNANCVETVTGNTSTQCWTPWRSKNGPKLCIAFAPRAQPGTPEGLESVAAWALRTIAIAGDGLAATTCDAIVSSSAESCGLL